MAAVAGAVAVNGHAASTPDLAHDDIHHLKRKRDDAADPISQDMQTDLLEVLRSADTTPSFLSFPLDGTRRALQSPKKARTRESGEPATIASQLGAAAYPTIQALKDDLSHVGIAIRESIRAQAQTADAPRTTIDMLKAIQRVEVFARLADELLHNEVARLAQEKGQQPVENKRHTARTADNALGSVLTLFGNAPAPKQLFSSMQSMSDAQTPSAVKARLAVEEMDLPVGLSATAVVPVSGELGPSQSTFQDTFPPPHGLPMLLPPKAQRRASTRDGTLTWEFKDHLSRGSKKGGWTVQSQTVGSWLGYGGTNVDQVTTSPREKRKQRDRALSGGESSAQAPKMGALAQAASNEEQALFRRAYSSFAPSRDNSRALVPAETKSTVWWQTVGESRYQDTFALDPALFDGAEAVATASPTEADDAQTDKDIELAIQELDDLDEDMPSPEGLAASEDEVERALQRISDLLETLASHQRIRHASLPSSGANTRAPISPAPLIAAKIGQPDAPAQEEVATYVNARHELARLVLKLPPYAVAKLNGEQFEELGVSRLISFRTPNVKGQMEEDQVARLAKHLASSAAAGVSNNHRRTSSSSQHYNATAQRTPAIGQAANTRYGQQYGVPRTPATAPSFQRTGSHGHHGTPTMSARPGYGQPMTQQRPAASHSYGHQYGGQQRPAYTNNVPAQAQHATAQPNTRPNYALSQGLYQQRPQAGFQSHQQAYNRTASPAKPTDYVQQPMPPRPSVGGEQNGAGRSTPQTPLNGYTSRPSSSTPQPPANGHA